MPKKKNGGKSAAFAQAEHLTVTPNPCPVGQDFVFQYVGGTPGTNVPWTLTGPIDDAALHAGSFVLDENGNSATYTINAMYAGAAVLSAAGQEVEIVVE